MDIATRRGGVFLTPLPFAKKACEYLEKIVGESWEQSPLCRQGMPSDAPQDYRFWDMAAGTGHLELFLPKEFQQYCYLSTLEQNDVRHLQKEFPAATVFQYNYLEDDVNHVFCPSPTRKQGARKMPDALQRDLENPHIKWIILVNPPYATAQESGLKGTSKEGVADTNIRKRMHAEHLGEVSRELYVQFLYRIVHEFKDRETLLGLFSPLKYLISTNYQKFRDRIFHAAFQSGFIFSSGNFGGTSKTSHFPVSFILWDIGKKGNVAAQEMRLDILNSLSATTGTPQKIGTKMVKPANRNHFLSRWIQRPRGTSIFPPFGSALTLKLDNVDTRNRIAEGFLASLMCPGNELQNQQQTAFLSGPQASAGALSVTPDNFEQAVVVFAARRIPKDSWINHVDQLLRPNRELSPQFITDCAVWSLFDKKNQTVALRNVEYQNKVYQIVNHFFPFPVSEVRNWLIRDEPMARALCDADNAFVSDWLAGKKLSEEAEEILARGREIYRLYFTNWHILRKAEFGIETYDAGWYQIQKTLGETKLGIDLLTELNHQHDQWKEKLLPQLHDYGILGE